MALAIKLGGTRIEPEVIDGADLDTPISTRDMEKILGGLEVIADAKTLAAGLVAEGYDAPRAWVNPVRGEVNKAGVKAGHVESVMQGVRMFLIMKLGEVFCGGLVEAGVVTGGNEEKLRQQMDSSKSFPEFPDGDHEFGWAPDGAKYESFLRALNQALETYNTDLAELVLQLKDNVDTEENELRIAEGSALSSVLGFVLINKCRMGSRIQGLIAKTVLDKCCGVAMLRTVGRVANEGAATRTKQRVDNYLKPPTCKNILDLATSIVKFNDNRAFLIKEGNHLAKDEDLAMKGFETTCGGVPQAKEAFEFVKKLKGEKITLADLEGKINDTKVGLSSWMADAQKEKEAARHTRGNGGAAATYKNAKALGTVVKKKKRRKKNIHRPSLNDAEEEAYATELEALNEPCINWLYWGNCKNRRGRCRRKHDEADKGAKAKLVDSEGKKVCMFHTEGLECNDGDGCKFSHESIVDEGELRGVEGVELGLVTKVSNAVFSPDDDTTLIEPPDPKLTQKFLTKSFSPRPVNHLDPNIKRYSTRKSTYRNVLYEPECEVCDENEHVKITANHNARTSLTNPMAKETEGTQRRTNVKGVNNTKRRTHVKGVNKRKGRVRSKDVLLSTERKLRNNNNSQFVIIDRDTKPIESLIIDRDTKPKPNWRGLNVSTDLIEKHHKALFIEHNDTKNTILIHDCNDLESKYKCGIIVIADSAATCNIWGKGACDIVTDITYHKVGVRISTVNGIVKSNERGTLTIKGNPMRGWICRHSPYTLLSIGEECRMNKATYVETCDSASLKYPSGHKIEFDRHDKLWGLKCGECGISSEYEHANPNVSTRNNRDPTLHDRGGHAEHDPDCEHCMRGRMRARAANRNPKDKIIEGPADGLKLYGDLMGPFEGDLDGNEYIFALGESDYGYITADGIIDKSSESTCDTMKEMIREIKHETNRPTIDVARVHTDQGNEFRGKFGKLIREYGARHTNTGGYRSHVNPTEGVNARIQQCVRAMIAACTGGHKYYKQLGTVAVRHACYCINRVDTKRRKSAYNKIWGKPYKWENVDHVFGSKCIYMLKDSETDSKWEAKADIGIWVGRDRSCKGNWVVPLGEYNADDDTFEMYRPISVTTVKVYDNDFILRKKPNSDTNVIDDPNFMTFIDKFNPKESNVKVSDDDDHDKIEVSEDELEPDEDGKYEVTAIIGDKHTRTGRKGRICKRQYIVEWANGEITTEPIENLDTCKELVKEYDDTQEAGLISISNNEDEIDKAVSALIDKQSLPGTVAEWKQGYIDEVKKVTDLRFIEVSEEEKSKVLRGNVGMRLRMILELKRDGRKKGRLVCQGFWEPKAYTNNKSDSPVASITSVRTLLAMGRSNKIKHTDPNDDMREVIGSTDVTTAFLVADKYKDTDPNRYVLWRQYKNAPVKVWRLNGPLYGQRDSSRRWFDTLVAYLTKELGFEQGGNEPCLFIHPVTGVKLALHVDDCITRGPYKHTVEFFNNINKRFGIKDYSILTPTAPIKHIGYSVSMTTDSNGIDSYWLDQTDDVRQFIIDQGIEVRKEVTCPMPDRNSILRDSTVLDSKGKTKYKSLTGKLSWFATSLRYDIAHAVSRLQQFNDKPTVSCMNAAVRVASYVSCTDKFKLGGESVYGNSFTYYCDSDHAGDRQLTLRSHTGMIAFINNIPIHWRSKKQPKTVISPAMAEIYALGEAVKEFQWVNWQAEDLGIKPPSPFTVQVDNNQAISFKRNSCLNSKIRGCVDLRLDWVVGLRDEGVCKVMPVKGVRNPADLLTKCLVAKEFELKLSLCSACDALPWAGPV